MSRSAAGRDDAGAVTAAGGPLAGRRALVTRAAEAAGDLAARLEALGAEAVVCPTIAIAPPEDLAAFDAALGRLDEADWVLFTSANAARAVVGRLAALGRTPASLGAARVGAVGPATAAALAAAGIGAAVVPEPHDAAALARALGDVGGRRLVVPRSDIARRELVDDLCAAGAEVDEVVAYRTVPALPSAAALAALRRGVDVATFTSGSAARSLGLAAGGAPAALLGRARVASIGPATSAAARAAGLAVHIEAERHTVPGLVEAIAAHFAGGAARARP